MTWSRFPRFTTSALAGVAALALSAPLAPVAQAQGTGFTDQELARMSLTAEWANGGWAKQTSSAYTNYDSFVERSGGGLELDTGISGRVNSPTNGSTASFSQSYGDEGSSNFGPSAFGLYSAKRNAMSGCAQAGTPFQPIANDNCSGFGYPNSGVQTRAKGFGLSSVIANPTASTRNPINWIIAADIRTAAECRPDGTSFALAPVVGGTNNAVRFRTSADLQGNVSDNYDVLIPPQVNRTVSGWARGRDYLNGGASAHYIHYRITSRQFTAPRYALSDLFVQVDIYRISDRVYLGTHESVMSRSECGVTTPNQPVYPIVQTFSDRNPPGFPSTTIPTTPVPEPIATDAPMPVPSTGAMRFAATPSGFGLQSMPMPELLEQPSNGDELPPAITVTSPLESATGTVTTTSAPPEPGATDVPTSTEATDTPAPATETVTSTAPVIPTEPADLGTTEQTSIAGNVTVPEGDTTTLTDAVVKGTELPADANEGAQVLNLWLTEQVQTNQDWTVFTSTGPDTDGWRWAAINQKTGTVVYIR